MKVTCSATFMKLLMIHYETEGENFYGYITHEISLVLIWIFLCRI